MTKKKLFRSIDSAMLGGVLAGLADYFEIDVTLLRVLFAFLSIFSGFVPGVLAYLVCWGIIPSQKIFD